MTTYQLWTLCFSIFQFIVTSGVGIYVWWNRKQTVTNSRFTAQEQRINELESKANNPAHCPGHAALNTRLDRHTERLDQHKDSLTAIEGELKHLPKTSDLEKIYDRINEVGDEFSAVKADVARISGAMPGITHLTQMMNQFLLNHGGKQ